MSYSQYFLHNLTAVGSWIALYIRRYTELQEAPYVHFKGPSIRLILTVAHIGFFKKDSRFCRAPFLNSCVFGKGQPFRAFNVG